MRRTVLAFVVSGLLIFLGVALLKGTVDAENDDPTASAANGAPRGLLALALLLEGQDGAIATRLSFADPPLADGALLVVPPPERSAWTEGEARELLAAVERGARLLVLCDEDDARNQRLTALLEAIGVACELVDIAIGDVADTRALGTSPGFARELFVRGSGRVRPRGPAPALPAWRVGNDDVVVKRAIGAGVVTVLGSATLLANDGLASAENAAFALDELARAPRRAVVFDERHHRIRNEGVWGAAFTRGLGPLTGLFALLLLVPLSLLRLAPRAGDPPRGDDEGAGAPAAIAQARALAALLARAGR